MDIKLIRRILKGNATVVLVEQGQPPLIVRQWQDEPGETAEEVPISARWPKARPPAPVTQDSVLERLNREIVSLKDQIAQEESPLQEEVQDN